MPTANELYQQAKVAGNVSFQAEWGRTQQQLAKLSAGERVSQLGFSSLEPGEYVMAYDALGQARMRIGHQSDGTVGVIYGNGTPPPVPSAPSVGARQLGVFIGWDGTFAGGYAKPGDFARIDVHMSEQEGFLPDGTTIVGTIVQEGGILVGADSVTHYIKLVAVNTSDVPSAATAQIAVLPLPAGQIAAGAIGAQQLAVDMAMISRVIVGDPQASRLELDGRIGVIPGMRLYDNSGNTTFNLDATTGDVSMRGSLSTSGGGTGSRLEIDGRPGSSSPGLRLFNASNVETLRLNALTGDVSLRGTLRTADTGQRVVIRENGTNEVRFYPNAGNNYSKIAAYDFGGGSTQFHLNSAETGAYTRIALSDTVINMMRYSGVVGTLPTAQLVVGPTTLQLSGGSERCILQTNNGYPMFGSDYYTAVKFNLISLDVVDGATPGTWRYVYAAGFDTKTSSRASKTAIEELPFDPEAVIADAPASMWERRAERAAARQGRGRVRKRLGPMVEDLPDEVVVDRDTEAPGVSLDAAIAVVWAATSQQTKRLAEHDDRFNDLTARLAVLEGAA